MESNRKLHEARGSTKDTAALPSVQPIHTPNIVIKSNVAVVKYHCMIEDP